MHFCSNEKNEVYRHPCNIQERGVLKSLVISVVYSEKELLPCKVVSFGEAL